MADDLSEQATRMPILDQARETIESAWLEMVQTVGVTKYNQTFEKGQSVNHDHVKLLLQAGDITTANHALHGLGDVSDHDFVLIENYLKALVDSKYYPSDKLEQFCALSKLVALFHHVQLGQQSGELPSAVIEGSDTHKVQQSWEQLVAGVSPEMYRQIFKIMELGNEKIKREAIINGHIQLAHLIIVKEYFFVLSQYHLVPDVFLRDLSERISEFTDSPRNPSPQIVLP